MSNGRIQYERKAAGKLILKCIKHVVRLMKSYPIEMNAAYSYDWTSTNGDLQ